jgi:beta-xylosidase
MNESPINPSSRNDSADWPWTPDQGDGTYRNPVIHADYSDPDVVRVGQDYYLTSSSFNSTPGLPILHSRDLVNWTIINHALKNLPDPRYAEVQHGQGVWAPAIRHHQGKFWIFFPTPDEGIYVITATDPAGEWSAPHMLLAGKGLIDPCPFWDDDGRAYLVHAYAASRAGIRNKLHIRPMSPDATAITGEGKVVIEIDPQLPALEGPKMHKHEGWYFILAPAGGVESGWQCAFRSRHIEGPYEERIVLAQRGTSVNGPHQGALVDTPTGDWWFMHFQDKGLYGRIVHLQPARWEDGWFSVGEEIDERGVGRPVMGHSKPSGVVGIPAIPQSSDDFASSQLGRQWQWHANHRETWHSLTARPGHLRLFPHGLPGGDLHKAPNLLLQKFPSAQFSVVTRLELPLLGDRLQAGLVVMGREWAALTVVRNEQGYEISLLAGKLAGVVDQVPGHSVELRLNVAGGGACSFGYHRGDGDFYQIGPVFQARPGYWIGAKVGLFCISPDPAVSVGHADFSHFHFAPLDPGASLGEARSKGAACPETLALA